MMNQKELEEQFRKCIEDLRPVIGDLSKTYPLEISRELITRSSFTKSDAKIWT